MIIQGKRLRKTTRVFKDESDQEIESDFIEDFSSGSVNHTPVKRQAAQVKTSAKSAPSNKNKSKTSSRSSSSYPELSTHSHSGNKILDKKLNEHMSHLDDKVKKNTHLMKILSMITKK